MNYTRNKNVTKLSKNKIIELIKQKPILVGNTSTAKQFFETDYEYDLTNCDLIGVPLLDNVNDIEEWADVQIIDKYDKQIKYLVYPDIYKCTSYTVYSMKASKV